MSALTRFLIVAAALSLWSAPAPAKEIKGAPKELIGYFAKSAEACRAASHNAFETLTIINSEKYWDEFSECADNSCRGKILSHRPVVSGFSLKVLYDNTERTLTVTRLRKNTYTFRFSDGDPDTVVHCKREDVVGGLGRPTSPESGEDGQPASRGSAEDDKRYSYSYAAAAVDYCDDLDVVKERFPSNFDWNAKKSSDEKGPQVYAEFDHRQLRTFCREMLEAFGSKGRIIPNLLRIIPAAKAIKDGPKFLEGVFSERPEKCRDWSEDDGLRVEFGSDGYNTCDGRVCNREIVSYFKTSDGFVLNVRHWLQKGKGPTSSERIKVIDKNTVFFVAPNPAILRRCPE